MSKNKSNWFPFYLFCKVITLFGIGLGFSWLLYILHKGLYTTESTIHLDSSRKMLYGITLIISGLLAGLPPIQKLTNYIVDITHDEEMKMRVEKDSKQIMKYIPKIPYVITGYIIGIVILIVGYFTTYNHLTEEGYVYKSLFNETTFLWSEVDEVVIKGSGNPPEYRYNMYVRDRDLTIYLHCYNCVSTLKIDNIFRSLQTPRSFEITDQFYNIIERQHSEEELNGFKQLLYE